MPVDENTGLPLNPDKTVTVYHHTNKTAAEAIRRTGVLKSAGEPDVYVTTEKSPTTGYGDEVVAINVDPKKLQIDDQFPDGRTDFRMSVGKPGGSMKVKVDAGVSFMPSDTDYLSAVNSGDTAAAQRMVDEAAKAAGYTVGAWHSTFAPKFTEFDMSKAGTSTGGWLPVRGMFFSINRDHSSHLPDDTAGLRRMKVSLKLENPLKVSTADALEKTLGDDYDQRPDEGLQRLKELGFDSVILAGGDEIIATSPSQIKSADPITRDDAGNVIPLSQRFKATSEDIRFMPDYSGEHRAPQRDSGAPLDNLKDVYPDDVYGPKGALYYGHASGDATDKAAIRILQSARNKPDAPVKVFRAIPKGIQSNEINPGDWITTIKSYAVQHGEGALGGDYKILEKTVPAGDLYTNGDSIFEFGYDPKFMPSPDSAMPGAYSFPGGYRAIPGKAKGSLRLYGPAGSLIGIAASLDEAQRIIRKKSKQ
jgi:hypothetical protein